MKKMTRNEKITMMQETLMNRYGCFHDAYLNFVELCESSRVPMYMLEAAFDSALNDWDEDENEDY